MRSRRAARIALGDRQVDDPCRHAVAERARARRWRARSPAPSRGSRGRRRCTRALLEEALHARRRPSSARRRSASRRAVLSTAFTSATPIANQSKRRCGPIGLLSGVSEQRRSPSAQRVARRPQHGADVRAWIADLGDDAPEPGHRLERDAQRVARAPSGRAATSSGIGRGTQRAGGIDRLRRRRREQHLQEIDARHAVDHAVVDLGDHREMVTAARVPRRSTSPRAASSDRAAAT